MAGTKHYYLTRKEIITDVRIILSCYEGADTADQTVQLQLDSEIKQRLQQIVDDKGGLTDFDVTLYPIGDDFLNGISIDVWCLYEGTYGSFDRFTLFLHGQSSMDPVAAYNRAMKVL